MPRQHPPLVERFRSRVVASETGCLLWTGATRKGYGWIRNGKARIATHRLAWILENGPVPDELNVLHHCDQPLCVSPDHLFLGTHAENVADRHAKGRDAIGRRHGRYTHPETTPRGDRHWTNLTPDRRTRGERVGGSKLTEDKVREIMAKRSQGWTLKSLANEYGVTTGAIHFIVTGQTWRHVTQSASGRDQS